LLGLWIAVSLGVLILRELGQFQCYPGTVQTGGHVCKYDGFSLHSFSFGFNSASYFLSSYQRSSSLLSSDR
jgi:hypothetical protein